jgi:NAD+ kinase
MAIVGLVLKREAPEALEAARPILAWCAAHGVGTATEPETAGPLEIPAMSKEMMFEKAAAVVVLGGDGTLLATARLCGPRKIPIVGVNLGTLGFLAETPLDQLTKVLEDALAGRAHVEERRMLRASVVRAGGTTSHHQALNDAVLSRGAMGRTIDLEARIDGEFLALFNADGLIVGTPTGSTAYNLSAGGPLIHPTVRVMILSPICPHALNMRPIVVHDSSTLELRLGSSREELLLTLDGQETVSVSSEDTIQISCSSFEACLVTAADISFYELLRRKLGWARR